MFKGNDAGPESKRALKDLRHDLTSGRLAIDQVCL